ncbi:MAG: extracellular solute-binding protein [Roseburia sp.]|nr:extracellular solute-binding protein [Roseburia sp.]
MRIGKKRGFIFLLLCSLILSMAGCGEKEAEDGETGEKGAAGAKGRYVEQIVAVPEDYTGKGSITVGEQGQITIVDTEQGSVFRSGDYGKTWEQSENKILKDILNKATVEVTSAVIAPDESFFISYILWNESTDQSPYPERYVYVDKKGTKKELRLKMGDGSSYVGKAVFTRESKLFVSLKGESMIYEIDGEKGKAYKRFASEGEVGEGFFMYYYGDHIAIHNEKNVSVYDPATEKILSSDTVLDEFVEKEAGKDGVVILGGNTTDKMMVVSRTGIYSHILNGSVMEQLAEGDLTCLSDPEKTPVELFVMDNDSILIRYEDGELDTYHYDSDVPSVPEKQLDIYSLYENKTVKRAISSFREENPDVYVRLEVGVSGEDGVTQNDAIKNLNTKLLAGSGPDIILLDGMPLDSYVEKGVLKDLSDVVNELEGQCGYYKNIFEAYSKDGKRYAVPSRFLMLLMSGDREKISSINDLKTMADRAEELSGSTETVFGTYDAEELLERLYPVCEGAWSSGDGKVDEDALSEFIVQAKRIYEAEQKVLDQKKVKEHERQTESITEYEEYPVGDSASLSGSRQIMNQYSAKQAIVQGSFRGMSDLRALFSVMRKNGTDSLRLFEGQSKKIFIPSGVLGITENSDEPELALAFLKEMLGERVQKSDLGDGFPVNSDALKNFSKDPAPDSSLVVAAEDSNEVLELKWPGKKELKQFEELVNEVETPADLNTGIREEIIGIGAFVLTEEMEVEDGVKEISQKITLLMEE